MYIQIVFPGNPKRYTYYAPFAVNVGDKVMVGSKIVTVVAINVERPQFGAATISGRA